MSAGHVNARVASDTHQANFLGMFEMTMAASGADEIPAILLDEFDHITHFHLVTVVGESVMGWTRTVAQDEGFAQWESRKA